MLRRATVAVSALLAAACGNDGNNPFAGLVRSRPPSAGAALVFVSGSWASEPGQPRELLAVAGDGSGLERLTFCAEVSTPCDVLSVAPSPGRTRVAAIRSQPEAEEGASALYFMDLSRSVETVLFPRRRVESVDWSRDDSFLLFSGPVPQTNQSDLFFSQVNGQAEENLTQTLSIDERNVRIDPFATTAVYERDEAGVSRIFLFRETPLTSGPATGEALPGTPYVVGSDASPVFSPDGTSVAFRRLTGVGNGGLGTWDLLTLRADGQSTPVVVATGPLFRGAPDWDARGIVFVETDAASRSELVVIQPDGSGRLVLRTEDAGFRMGAPRWLAGS